MRKKRLLFLVPAFLVGAAVFIAIGGLVVRELWNWLMPAIFGLPVLSFWQAVGVLALSRILFGGFGRGGGGRYGRRRWGRMTPEERERFRQRMRERFGPAAP